MSQLLNEEIQRIQHLAGFSFPKHDFEIFLEEYNHLSINKMIALLLEADNKEIGQKAKDYIENQPENIQKAAAVAASKISKEDGDYENLTADEIGNKVVNLAPGGEIKNYSLKQRLVAATMALLLASNALGVTSWMGKQIFKAKEGNKIEVGQTKKDQNQLNDKNTANFKDAANTTKALKINPNLKPTKGDPAGSLQYKISGYKISGEQAQELDKHSEDIVKTIKNGSSVKIHAKSGYSNQPNDPDNENKAVDGKKLDDARANSFKQYQKQSIKKVLDKEGLKYEETPDGFKIQTTKGTQTITIDSQIAGGEGAANKVGDVDQGTVFNDEVIGSSDYLATDFQLLLKNPGLPRMPKDKPTDTNKTTEPKTDTDRANVADKVGQEKSGAGESKNGQRNTQLAIILNMANDTANTFKELGVPYSTRLTQSVLNKAESGKAKDLADLIVAIRKNPDYFLKKVSNVTGQSIGQRTKQTNRFAESLQLEALLHEGKIDDLLLKVGITDNDIKANADVIIKSLTKIYGLGSAAPTSSTEPKTSGDTTSTTSDTKDKISFDAKTLLKDINNNTLLKSRLKLIDNDQELIDLLSTLTDYVNTNLSKTQLKSAFTSTSNKVKSMKEEEEKETTDSYAVKDIIEKNTLLKQHLSNINTPQEFSDLLVTMLMFIDPSGKITKDRQRIARLIFSAQNQIKRK